MRRLSLLLAVVFIVANTAQAQSGGQLWVRAFEDRNANGTRDAGEPLLTRGIGVNLLNAEGVTIASQLLDNSPTATQGLVGFQGLIAGDYTVVVTSADYSATAGNEFAQTVSEEGQPVVVEYGAQLAPLAAADSAATETGAVAQRDQLLQVGVAALGALIVVVGMIVLGVLVYLVTLRRRLLAARAADVRMTTGSMRRVPTGDTGEYRSTDTGDYPSV